MKRHFHFMGIGGISMSGLARHYQLEGHTVSGCDASDTPTLAALRAGGIEVHQGHSPEHLHGVDTLVSTMAAPNPLIPGSVEEVEGAARLGIESIKRMELLGRLFTQRDTIGVTGSHGKSTITGMIATVMTRALPDTSVQIGANLPLIGGNMKHGPGRWLVAEVDESDPGFARLKTKLGVIPNLEDDHVATGFSERRNYHASLEDLQAAVLSYADNAGQLLRCSDSASLDELLGDRNGTLTYGFHSDSDYLIQSHQLNAGGSTFVLRLPDGSRVSAEIRVPGLHNVQNAAAALAAAHLSGVPAEEAATHLADYAGVGRRWQIWGEPEGALVVDEYAHHPAEVTAVLAAARNTGRRVRAVLQPHRWIRTALHWRALADAAAAADEVLVLDIYAAGEEPIPGVSSAAIAGRIGDTGIPARHTTAEEATAYLRSSLQENDLVITLGAGDVWRVAASLTGND